ncbi:SRPBCC family protein [Nonomuraea candida]|uniref:SRPBCC family protein n=1 Tax=Nonomuraea candida TaxID=359159 RepID=UPI0005BBFA30|nr:SRPBCC domain-containing protein [Nonomuraea candida]
MSGKIEITRVLEAPRDVVYAAWTQPEHFTHWWGAPLETISMDVRPGGEWKATIVVDEENQVPFAGVYQEIVPNERLVYTLVDLSGREPAEQQAAGPETVTVTFSDSGSGTKMVFVQEGNLPDDEIPRAAEGWGFFFDALGEYVTKIK